MNLDGDVKALWGIYLKGLIILRNRWVKNTISFFLSPALYALAFGWGVGSNLEMHGVPYLTFMLPGLIALSGMNQSISIASEINFARFTTCCFEEYLLSPANNLFIVLGNVLYGVTKGVCSFLAVLLIGLLFSTRPANALLILFPVLINSFMFASLGVWIALTVKTHRDLNSFISFVIVPISFVAGTFFSLDSLPDFYSMLVNIIPLTHASLSIRAIFIGEAVSAYHFLIMGLYTTFFFIMALRRLRKAVA